MTGRVADGALRGNISRAQLFALGFGSIVGSAWVVILNQWLLGGGPGGAVLGFLAGGVVVLAVGACYAELTTRIPTTGAEFVFALQVYGRPTGFFVGWFVTFAWICITVFEGLAVAWFLEKLLPPIADVTLYEAFGSPVTRNQLLVGTLGALVIGAVNHRGAKAAAPFQAVLTYGFLALALVVLLFMVGHGNAARLHPLFPVGENGWWVGAAGIFASCAFLLNGFQSVSQVVEERSEALPLATVARIMLLAIAAAVAFYCLVVIAASLTLPWPVLAGSDLAMVRAAASLPGGAVLSTVVLVAATASLVKTWNAVFLVATRSLLALAREKMLPGWIAHVDPRSGAPVKAVIVVGALNIAGLALGRGAISALVDTTAMSVIFCFVLICAGVVILRRRALEPAPYRVAGAVIAVALAGSVLMAAAAVVAPFLRDGALALEHYLFIAWAALGGIIWLASNRRQRI